MCRFESLLEVLGEIRWCDALKRRDDGATLCVGFLWLGGLCCWHRCDCIQVGMCDICDSAWFSFDLFRAGVRLADFLLAVSSIHPARSSDKETIQGVWVELTGFEASQL